MPNLQTMEGAELREQLRRLEAVRANAARDRAAELDRGIANVRAELERRRKIIEADARV